VPPVPRPIVVAPLAAAALGVPAAASAQRSTIPEYGAGLTRPPVPLAGADPQPAPSPELPHTGLDRRMLFLTGLAPTLIGLGTRLRTADGALY
jgi:hypothetical protein